jgi:DNA-binding transcriptional regulator LsrR (DeoR family)
MVLTRLERGWTQARIAHDLGLRQQVVSYHVARLRALGELSEAENGQQERVS